MRHLVAIVLALVLVPIPALAADAPHDLTLAEALALAKAHQPSLASARAATAAARARQREALGPMLPNVGASLGYQRTTANYASRPGSLPSSVNGTTSRSSFDTFDYMNASASVSQLVYDFGQTPARHDAASALTTSQVETEKATGVDVAYGVRAAYFTAWADRALVKVAEDTLANQKRHLAQVEAFIAEGTRPKIDLAQARTDVANAEVGLIRARAAYDVARTALDQAIGVVPAAPYDVADEQMPAVVGEDTGTDALLKTALAARPEIASLEARIASQQATVRAEQGGLWPRLSVTVGASDAGTQIGALAWNAYAGASLSWSIWDGGQSAARVQEADATLRGMRADLRALRQSVRAEVEAARLGVVAAKSALAAAGEAATNAAERLKLAEGRYQTGAGSAIELGDAQLALTQAEAQKVSAEQALSTARAALLKALGRG